MLRNAQYSQKAAIKEKILNRLKENELQVISLTVNQQNIFWEEEGKEFLFNGGLYDVVKIKKVNGEVILYCINDKTEKALIEKYGDITKHNSSPDKKAKLNLDNSINLFIYQNEVATTDFPLLISNNFSPFNLSLPCNITDKISPPPKA